MGSGRPARGPSDQAAIEERADVRVYTPPLEEPVEVTVPIMVTLYAAPCARDTAFTTKLVDVHPDGKAILLKNGIPGRALADPRAVPVKVRSVR